MVDVVRKKQNQFFGPCTKKRDEFWEADRLVIGCPFPFPRRLRAANSIDATVDNRLVGYALKGEYKSERRYILAISIDACASRLNSFDESTPRSMQDS